MEDYFKLREKGHIQLSEKTKYPTFLRDMPTYLKCLDQIAEYNELKWVCNDVFVAVPFGVGEETFYSFL